MLQKCFGRSTVLRTQVVEWYKAFSGNREVIEDVPQASCLLTLMTIASKKLKKTMLENRRVSRGFPYLLLIDSKHFEYEAC